MPLHRTKFRKVTLRARRPGGSIIMGDLQVGTDRRIQSPKVGFFITSQMIPPRKNTGTDTLA